MRPSPQGKGVYEECALGLEFMVVKPHPVTDLMTFIYTAITLTTGYNYNYNNNLARLIHFTVISMVYIVHSQGNDLFKEGRYELAVECYSKAAELDSLNAIMPANRAMALLKLQR